MSYASTNSQFLNGNSIYTTDWYRNYYTVTLNSSLPEIDNSIYMNYDYLLTILLDKQFTDITLNLIKEDYSSGNSTSKSKKTKIENLILELEKANVYLKVEKNKIEKESDKQFKQLITLFVCQNNISVLTETIKQLSTVE